MRNQRRISDLPSIKLKPQASFRVCTANVRFVEFSNLNLSYKYDGVFVAMCVLVHGMETIFHFRYLVT